MQFWEIKKAFDDILENLNKIWRNSEISFENDFYAKLKKKYVEQIL